jgi:hypothetical protein
MKTILLYIVIIFSPVCLSGQSLRPATDSLVKKLLKYEYLSYKCIGRVCGRWSYPYCLYLKFEQTATINELLLLTKHDTSRIKGYAGWALVDRKYPKIDSIILNFMTTKEKVFSAEGCIIPNLDYLAAEVYKRLVSKLYPSKRSKQEQLYFKKQLTDLNRKILSCSDDCALLWEAIYNNHADPITYDRIKELASQGNKAAITELGNYKNK